MKQIFLALLLVLPATMGFAHSEPDTTSPANGAVLAEMPPNVVLSFASRIRLTNMRITPEGQPAIDLELGDQKAFATRFVVPVMDLGRGAYQIEWRGLAADGHAVRGVLTFEVQ